MIRTNILLARSVLALGLAAGLAGCNSNASPVVAADSPPIAAPSGPPLPAGAPCTAAIRKWQALISSDVRTGMVDQSVYRDVEGEMTRARAACAAGRDALARRLVQASRKRHGYPPG